MEGKKRLLTAMILGVLLLALGGGLSQTGASMLLFLETGRFVPDAPPGTEPTEPTLASEPAPSSADTGPAVPVFSADALADISLLYGCDYRPQLQPLLTQPLQWTLQGDAPTVLILHTHATEAYRDTPGYRSRDEKENMVSIGRELARVLQAGGIRVIHDTAFHDVPDYNTAYSNARQSIIRYLARYPDICLVLDLHRDASDDPQQLTTVATAGGQRSAQVMLVVGTDARGNPHPEWQQNLALALKLTAAMEQENPGICRPVNLRSERFNMDLTPGSLLVEVGAAGNTQHEAMLAVNALAQAILSLSRGANLPAA